MPHIGTQLDKKNGFALRCFNCGQIHEIDDYGRFYYCKKCGGILEVKLSRKNLHGKLDNLSTRGVWKYFDLIPLWSAANVVSIQEGDTLLVECRNLAHTLGLKSLFVKFEGLNPTGSFKDRGMTVGVSKAKELGFKRVICASTGNTSASLAAYSAKANLSCTVLVPKGKIATGKIAQAIVHGAEIVQVEGNFDDCLRMAEHLVKQVREVLLLNSLNPFRIEGQKTTSFEIVEQLGFVPDYVILPVGNGGNISSLWKGFKEVSEFGFLEKISKEEQKRLPKMIGIQAEGAAPIARAFLTGKKTIDQVKEPHTGASAINIGSPVNWTKALGAIYDSNGNADLVGDEEIFSAQKLLASKEGLFVEPASATPIAYLRKISKKESSSSRDLFEQMKQSTIVCITTGNGLKDPDAVTKDLAPNRLKVVSADSDSLQKLLLIPA